MMRKKIDFIGIGAQRCGTTWLYARLNELPEFSLPPIKELHYFDRNIRYPSPNKLTETHLIKRLIKFDWVKSAVSTLYRNKKDLKTATWYFKWFFSYRYNDDWYLSLFNSLNGLKGEITPSYGILEKKDIYRMFSVAPEAKLIVILRNPVERAWSHYRFSGRRKKGEDFQMEESEAIKNFVTSKGQELRSNYMNMIEKYSTIFPKNQILVCFYDAIRDNPLAMMSEIVDFIGGDKNNIPIYCNLRMKNNVSKKIDMPIDIQSFLKEKYYDQIKTLAEEFGSYPQKWYSDLYGKSLGKTEVLSPTISIQ